MEYKEDLERYRKIKATGTFVVSGFTKEGETEEEAKIRLTLLAETTANKVGDVRLHLNMK